MPADDSAPAQGAAKHAGGRPTKYKPTFPTQAAKACEAGFTDKELADLFGVNVDTIYEWKLQHPEFSEALKSGKVAADDRVERSLYHRAVGYTFESEKVFQFQGAIIRTATVEHVPPDTTAGIFWLKNRKPADWRDRQEITGAGGLPLLPATVTVYQLPDNGRDSGGG